jgi:hypothetical protein
VHYQTYHFAFTTVQAARGFVFRLTRELMDIAIYRDESEVHVIDGGDEDQRERIYQLARASSASHVINIP